MIRFLLATSIAALLFILPASLQAQPYKTGVGARAAWFSGITVKHFLSSEKAIEGILSSRWRGVALTGLFEIEKSTKTDNLFVYYGFGAHVANYHYWYYRHHWKHWDDPYYHDRITTFGIDGILGVEYVIQEVPFAVSLDLKPFINFMYWGGDFWDMGLSIRYYF